MDIRSMTTAEKLRAMEQLWDSLENSEVAPPAWHGEVLAERRKGIEGSPERFVSLNAVKKRGGPESCLCD